MGSGIERGFRHRVFNSKGGRKVKLDVMRQETRVECKQGMGLACHPCWVHARSCVLTEASLQPICPSPPTAVPLEKMLARIAPICHPSGMRWASLDHACGHST